MLADRAAAARRTLAARTGADGRAGTDHQQSQRSGDRAINEIYISAKSADTWGTDRLEDSTLAVGASSRIKLGRTRDCLFDVQILYEDATREDHLAVDLCRTRLLAVDGRNATPLAGMSRAPHVITVQNRSPRPIQQVFISPAYAEQWGDDLLGHQLAEGDNVQLPYRGDCAADLRVVFANRAAEERRGLDVCTSPTLTIAPGWTTADPALHSEALP